MESRIFNLFLGNTQQFCKRALLFMLLSTNLASEERKQVIEPDVDRREIEEPAIDSGNFEIGIFTGMMNVRDFGTNPVIGARFGYHVTEDIFIEASYAQTETDETSFERLSGNIQLLDNDDHSLRYYNASFGFNLLPGEGFLGKKYAFTSALFLIGGIGGTDFAGDDHTTWNAGVGYRILLNDSFSIRIDARDHVFDLDLLGEKQTNHDLEFTAGVSIYF